MAELPIVSMQVYDERPTPTRWWTPPWPGPRRATSCFLIDMGGNWCPDCVVLHNLMLVPAMQKFVDAHYEVAMVDVGKFDRNPQIAARYGYNDKAQGRAHHPGGEPATTR